MLAHNYYVYILTNNSGTLYVGFTNSMERRIMEHKSGIGSRFTGKYALGKLVYYEHFSDVNAAIARGTQIKHWTRAKKIALIEKHNPGWLDLALHLD